MSLIKQAQDGDDYFQSAEFAGYKSKLNTVSCKIDQWHVLKKEQNADEFVNDSDFQNLVGSPNEFFEESDDSICSGSDSMNQKT